MQRNACVCACITDANLQTYYFCLPNDVFPKGCRGATYFSAFLNLIRLSLGQPNSPWMSRKDRKSIHSCTLFLRGEPDVPKEKHPC